MVDFMLYSTVNYASDNIQFNIKTCLKLDLSTCHVTCQVVMIILVMPNIAIIKEIEL